MDEIVEINHSLPYIEYLYIGNCSFTAFYHNLRFFDFEWFDRLEDIAIDQKLSMNLRKQRLDMNRFVI
jgi:hypothetical protein